MKQSEKMFTVRISKFVRVGRPEIPESCGHIHMGWKEADNCRISITRAHGLSWTDASLSQVE